MLPNAFKRIFIGIDLLFTEEINLTIYEIL